jgi:hypothetical protein
VRQLLVIVFLLVGASVPCKARSPIPPAQLADLATAWLGGAPRPVVEYFRLELDGAGKGILIVQWLPRNSPRLYEVSVARLKAYDVEFDVRPVDSDAQAIYLRGKATILGLDLELGDIERNWKRKIYLEREDEVLERIRMVTERARLARPRD